MSACAICHYTVKFCTKKTSKNTFSTPFCVVFICNAYSTDTLTNMTIFTSKGKTIYFRARLSILIQGNTTIYPSRRNDCLYFQWEILHSVFAEKIETVVVKCASKMICPDNLFLQQHVKLRSVKLQQQVVIFVVYLVVVGNL